MALLEVDDLRVSLAGRGARADVLRGVSFSADHSEIVGIVGESGSGKTMTGLAILGLLPDGISEASGAIRLDGLDLLSLDRKAMRQRRGRDVGMIFQNPSTALDPMMRVGDQLVETVRAHERVTRSAASARAIEMLRLVEIPDPERVGDAFAHQLSGGLCQRAMIAIALCCQPRVLVADEPTTALDVTIQAQVLDLLRRLADDTGMAVILVTHDFGVVAEVCDRVLTMYSGEIVEAGTTGDVLGGPMHPYTAALLACTPDLEHAGVTVRGIPGMPPTSIGGRVGCSFAPRCSFAEPRCRTETPRLRAAEAGRSTRCLRSGEIDLEEHSWA